ncbi:ABC transporter permease [[Mycoplasma] falconis]|uniref:ABC transporter permease n=1 Tax=[Mycoplasma] falconis TaxID=92403 RepID=A0A501XAJ5_9BACT|nr:ABC transporter permease [[Mycoplasma] falconis]TPE57449.1 ABC transporter permease [[Mycoplasma] falconis]
MKRLFKEVFKSLARNKVTIVCLTILIFLTTFLFTLLNDVKTSYSSTINAYDKVSKLHDITVDLDVNSYGVIPKSGYNQIGEDNEKITAEPATFEDSHNGSNLSYSLSLPNKYQAYIPLKDTFTNYNVADKSLRISTEDFMNLYYKSNIPNSGVSFELAKQDDWNSNNIKKFKLTKPYEFKLYQEVNGKVIPVKKEILVKKGQTLNLLHNPTINNVFSISYAPRGLNGQQTKADEIYIINPLYVNVETLQASFLTADYNQWEAEQKLAVISPEEVAKLFGLDKNSNGNWTFDEDNQKLEASIKLQDDFKSTNKTINASDKLKLEINIDKYLEDHLLKASTFVYDNIPNGEYEIPYEFVRETSVDIVYNWYRYILNWNEQLDENESNWKGSYFKFISEYQKNNPEAYDKLLYFTYWDKTVKTNYKIGGKLEYKTESTKPIEKEDLNKVFKSPWNGGKENKKIPVEKQNLDHKNLHTIKQVEFNKYGEEIVSSEEFKTISDINSLKEYQNLIHQKTQNYAHESILNSIKNEVGEDNIGVKQSLTVETIDEDTSRKNVFHFVNTGDKDRQIYGITQNVDKLYNETLNPGILNSSITQDNVDRFILKPDPNNKKILKIPSVYTKELIQNIFRAYTPSVEYFDADIRFEDYYDFLPNTKIPYLKNGKLLLITTDITEPWSPQGGTIIGAITRPEDGKYILLKYSPIDGFINKPVWNRIDINNNQYLNLNELYNYMVTNGYTIKGNIGENGWAYVDPYFKNSINLPVQFGSISPDLTSEIYQKNSIKGLIDRVAEVISTTDLQKIFRKDDLKRLFNAIRTSIEKNNLHMLLATSKINNSVLEKTLLEIIKYLIHDEDKTSGVVYSKTDVNSFLKSMLNNVIDYFKQKYLTSGDTQAKRDEYLVSELSKLNHLININSILVPSLNLGLIDILSYLEDKSVILDVLKQIIDSIDFVKFSNIIENWFEKHPYKQFTAVDKEYWAMSHDRILISFLQSVDSYKLKTALVNLINTIDFEKVLSPESTNSIYQKWLQVNKTNLSESQKQEVKDLFNKLNGNDNADKYKNIGAGLYTIIQNFDLNKFIENLEYLIKHETYPITANGRIYNNFNTESLQKSDYIASALSATVSIMGYDDNFGKVSQIQDAIITLFNLSSKTEKINKDWTLAYPAKDNQKISIWDLTSLSNLTASSNDNKYKYSFDKYNIEDIDKLSLKIKNVLKNNDQPKLTLDEYNFLTNDLIIDAHELDDLANVLVKIAKYREIITLLKPNGFYNKQDKYDFNETLNIKDINSYWDLAYYSASFDANSSKHKDDIEVLKSIHNVLAPNVAQLLGVNGSNLTQNVLSLYAIWIKLAYKLNELADVESKIETDLVTGEKKIVYITHKKLDYKQISAILTGFLEASLNPEILNEIANFKKVRNPIPSFGVLGADKDYQSTSLRIAYANAQSYEGNKLFENLLAKKEIYNNFFNSLTNLGIKDQEVLKQIKNIFDDNSYELSQNLGLLASSSEMPTNYLNATKLFVNNFIANGKNEITPLISDDYSFDLLYKNTLSAGYLQSSLQIFNIPGMLINPFVLISFPQIVLYYAVSPNPNEGNLVYIVKQVLNNLRFATIDDIRKQYLAVSQTFIPKSKKVASKTDESIDLDVAVINNIFKNLIVAEDGSDLIIFDINVTESVKKAVLKTIEPITIPNAISYTDAGSYLAKVNYGYFANNNKKVYEGDISKYLSDPYSMQLFIEELPSEYKIVINNQQYLIIGVDSSADYLYPVVNEENLQVDPKTQAIIFVNQKGFDRMYSAYPTFAIKSYAVVKAPVDAKGKEIKGKTKEELVAKFNKIIDAVAPSSAKKVFYANEQDPLNPERYIRVVTIRQIVSTIKNATIYLITVLTFLVSFIVYFIIRRYIEARNKVIGILRAQGYKSKEIALSFCVFGWIPAIVGAIVGYIIGFALQGPAMSILASYWTLERNIIPFNPLALIMTILVPLIFVSLLIFIITLISVRRKPTELMSGLTEVSVGNVARRFSLMFRRLPVKARFIASMALNNFWKMFSLFLAFSTTSLISMFFLSSNNVFNKAITKTYKDRLYNFKLDLETPTTEGGPYITYNKNDLNNYLYVPNDLAGNASSNGSQLDYNNPNFMRPGSSFNTDVIQKPFDPTVITKSSLDLLMDLSVELSPWDITYANMPETQKARVTQIFKRVSKAMEGSQQLIDIKKLKEGKEFLNPEINSYYEYQRIIAVRDLDKYINDHLNGLPEDYSNRTSYFIFSGKNHAGYEDTFMYVEWNPEMNDYMYPIRVTTAKARNEYRQFLINAYQRISLNDYYVSFGGVFWNDATNEKYTYAQGLLNNKDIRIYGYYSDSQLVRLHDNKNQDLSKLLDNYDYKFDSEEAIPIVVNDVAARKYHWKVGSTFSVDITNHVDRFAYQALMQKAPKLKYEFKVIGISETYINTELVTRKDILDHILGFDTLANRLRKSRKYELKNAIYANPDKVELLTKQFNRKYDAFNGVLSIDKTPVQTIDTLTTYSSTGFWGAASSFDVASASEESLWAFFKRIFISDPTVNFISVYEHNIDAYNEAHPEAKLDYKETLKKLLNVNDLQLEEIRSLASSNEKYKNITREVLTKFYGTQSGSIYGKNIMYGASFDVNSKDIEVGFIEGISKTVNTILVAFILISLLICIIILVVITNIMIASNQRSIATFSVLGYTNKEKIFLFFFNFVPAIIMACLLMIPVTISIIAIFNAFMMATSQISLPLILYISNVLLSMVICLTVFTLTSIATWNSLNKVKAVDALKGK